jgi:hypothetical protein
VASIIETNGQIALAYLRLGQEEESLVHAEKALKLSEKLSPTVYSMDLGFSGIADVYFELWEKSLHDPAKKAESDQLRVFAQKSVKLLVGFQKVFPFGQSITPIYQAWYEWLTSKPEAAIKSLKRGLEASLKFKMVYEEGLIRLKLAAYAPQDLDARTRNLSRAIEIFEKMGAFHELRRAQEEAQKAIL